MEIERHSDEMLSAIQCLPQVDYELSSYEFSCALYDQVTKHFVKECKYQYPMWDNLQDWIGVDYRFSWEWFSDLLKSREVILFFEPDDDWRMFTFKDGSIIPQILNNCYGFVFYVTDIRCSFLLSYNDHDNLLACGLAKNWLRTYHVIENEKVSIVDSSLLG